MITPKDIKTVTDLTGYTVVASQVWGPIVIWDNKHTVSLFNVHSQGAQLSFQESREVSFTDNTGAMWVNAAIDMKVYAHNTARAWLKELDDEADVDAM